MRRLVLLLLSAALVLTGVTPARAQGFVLLRTFTNPAPAGGDLFGTHQFGTSVGWLDGQVLIGAPGVDFGQQGQSQFLADHGMVYLFDPASGALLASVSPTTRVQQAGFSVAGIGGHILTGGPSVCCPTATGAFLLDPDTGAQVRSFEMRDVFLGLGTVDTGFGFAVSPIGPAGGMIAVGAPTAAAPGGSPTSGAAFIYNPSSSVPLFTLMPPPPSSAGRFGSALTPVGNDKVLIGAPGLRKAFVYDITTGLLLTTLSASNSEFGAAVAAVGDSYAIGAPGTGQARGTVRVGNQAGQVGGSIPSFAELTEPGGRFGATIATFGLNLLAGAPASDSAFHFVDGQGLVPLFSGIADAGVVYLNGLDGTFLGTLVSPSPQPGDRFGASVAVFGNHVLIGAPGADGGRGAVYLFQSQDSLPVALGQAVSTSEDTPRAITLQATDNAPGLVYSIVGSPSHGTLSGTPPNVTYTPVTNFNGADAFTFKARDAAGFDSNVATVSITVVAINDAPVALNQTRTTVAQTAANITLTATDADGDSLSFSLLSQPANGTLSGTPPTLTYTPNPGFSGADGFTFRASDGKAASNIATVSLSVVPGVTIANVTLKEGNAGTTAFSFPVKLSVPSTKTVSVKFASANGTAVAGSDYTATTGTLSFAPGETTKTITVAVMGDQLFEPDETFLVVLSAPVNASIVDGTAVGSILNDDPVLGVTSLVPATATVAVHERVELDLTWTHPEAWRKLKTIDLTISDDRGKVLWARFHEGRDVITVVHDDGARLDLKDSGILASNTQTVTLRFDVRFKPSATGRTVRVEAAAKDDAGNQQGFERVGTLRVLRKNAHTKGAAAAAP